MTGCKGIAVDLIIKNVTDYISFAPSGKKKLHPSVTVFVVVENHFGGSVLISVRYNEISLIDHNYQRLL